MKILEEFYYGNIRPDVKFYGKDSQYVELARLREKKQRKSTGTSERKRKGNL